MTARPVRLALACTLVVLVGLVAGCEQVVLQFQPPEGALPGGQVGQPYDVTVSISENVTPVGDISLGDGQLPPGLVLTYAGRGESTATISGAPTAAGSYTFTVTAWCLGTSVSGQTGARVYTINVVR